MRIKKLTAQGRHICRCLPVILGLICIPFFACATNYYLDDHGDDSRSGTSAAKAWKSLSKLQEMISKGAFVPGDSILFKRGSRFSGHLSWTTIWGQHATSGLPGKPIVLSAYGSGPKPVFMYASDKTVPAAERKIFFFAGVEHIVVHGLAFTDPSMPEPNKLTPAENGIAIYLGMLNESVVKHILIEDVDISHCGLGIVIVGDSNTVRYCRMQKFGNLVNTRKEGDALSTDDYGANALTITGNDNLISHNTISDAWAVSFDYAWNGGACELFNSCNRNRIEYNRFYDCGGLAEFGGNDPHARSSGNVFANNLLVNCGAISYFNLTGVFAIRVVNTQYLRNTVIENHESRFSGPNTGRGLPKLDPPLPLEADKYLFSFDPDNKQDSVIVVCRDNIFYLGNGMSVFRKDMKPFHVFHEGNTYYLDQGSEVNLPLQPSEKKKDWIVFRDDSSPATVNWSLGFLNNENVLPAGLNQNPRQEAVWQTALALWIIKPVYLFTLQQPLGDKAYYSYSQILRQYKALVIFLKDFISP